jgi:TolB protein
MRLVGALVAMLCFLVAPAATQAAFPGQNGKIAFDSGTLRTVNPDGSGEAPLIEQTGVEGPAWSADGLKLVFTRNTGPQDFFNEIWVVNADGTGETQLTEGQQDFRPAFSPDGTKIVFSRNGAIWEMDANGDNQHQVVDLPEDDEGYEPVYSPDGTKIAFTWIGNPFFHIAVGIMDADGTDLVELTPTDADSLATQPDFSPDGSTIVFSYCPTAIEGCVTNWRIATVPAGQGAIVELTTPPPAFDDFAPVFSPDGQSIAFYREERVQIGRAATRAPGDASVHTVAASGGLVTPISSGTRDKRPDWQPVKPTAGGGAAGQSGGSFKNKKKCRGVAVTIRTTNGDDTITGTPGRDVVHGLSGNDVIKGLRGDDRLCGGRGNDRLLGGPGLDILFGGDDVDFLDGGSGADDLFGGTPNAPDKLFKDTCQGGKGKDTFQNCQKGSG